MIEIGVRIRDNRTQRHGYDTERLNETPVFVNLMKLNMTGPFKYDLHSCGTSEIKILLLLRHFSNADAVESVKDGWRAKCRSQVNHATVQACQVADLGKQLIEHVALSPIHHHVANNKSTSATRYGRESLPICLIQ
jgi:hypothetical protein